MMLNNNIPLIKVGNKIIRVDRIVSIDMNDDDGKYICIDCGGYKPLYIANDSDKAGAFLFYLDILEKFGAMIDIEKVYQNKEKLLEKVEEIKKEVSRYSNFVGNPVENENEIGDENISKLKEYIKNKMEGK